MRVGRKEKGGSEDERKDESCLDLLGVSSVLRVGGLQLYGAVV